MFSVTTTVVDLYRYVVGVDTHAATHSYAIVAALRSSSTCPVSARSRPR